VCCVHKEAEFRGPVNSLRRERERERERGNQDKELFLRERHEI